MTTTPKQNPRRLNIAAVSPAGFQAMFGLEKHVRASGLGARLIHLVKLRASQINGCAYCIDMHTKDARAEGETEQRLYGLVAWRETDWYTPRERAALEWTEALTLIHEEPVSDQLFARVSAEFSPPELSDLALTVVTINGWNRLAIAFGNVPGSYERAGS
ncbi:carboxymuconolactone decarboxylase family protein [Haliangium sp.]|uniref:carboxymuconolactone decarboxylase family protein n=1 Tax=Haliangium sp. TaxID=2663208 RepID=UPI003D0D14AB